MQYFEKLKKYVCGYMFEHLHNITSSNSAYHPTVGHQIQTEHSISLYYYAII